MAAELMVINPIRRKRKMSAKQRKYFGKRRSTSRRRVTRARRNPVASFAASPVRRKRSRRRYFSKSRSRARSYIRRQGGISGIVTGTLIPAGIGAAGALAVDMAWGRLPIPDALKTGIAAPITRLALAVGVGYAVGMVAGKSFGQKATAGAVVVTLYDLLKAQIAPSVPAATATGFYPSELGYYSSARMAGLGMYARENAY